MEPRIVNKGLFLLITVLTMCVVGSMISVGNAASAKDSILIGINHDVTGINADGGRAQRDGAIMCIEDWNKKGGIRGHEIKYVFRDNAGDPAKATTIAHEFERNKVVAVLGATSSTVGIAEAKVLSPSQIPLMGGSASSKHWDYKGPDGKSYYFSFATSDAVHAVGQLDVLARQGYKKIAIAYLNLAWPTDLLKYQLEYIKKEYGPKYGMEVVGTVECDAKATDLTKEVSKVKAMNPDAVCTTLYGSTYIPWYRAYNLFNYHPPTSGIWVLAETVYLSMEKSLLYNYIGLAQVSDEKKLYADMRKRFIDRWGYTPVGHCGFGYQQATTLLEAMEAVGFEGPKIRDYIASQMTGRPIYMGSTKATCFFQEGTPYNYSIFGPEGWAAVHIGEKGEKKWLVPSNWKK